MNHSLGTFYLCLISFLVYFVFQQRERVASVVHRQETVDCLKKFNARRKLKVSFEKKNFALCMFIQRVFMYLGLKFNYLSDDYNYTILWFPIAVCYLNDSIISKNQLLYDKCKRIFLLAWDNIKFKIKIVTSQYYVIRVKCLIKWNTF